MGRPRSAERANHAFTRAVTHSRTRETTANRGNAAISTTDLDAAGWRRLADYYAQYAEHSGDPDFWRHLERQARAEAAAATETTPCTEEETRAEAAQTGSSPESA